MLQTAVSWSILTQALGWTVVHSLWQIALIYLVFKALSWLFQRNSRAGYAWALVAMSAAAIWSGATFKDEYQRIAAVQAISNEHDLTKAAPLFTDFQQQQLRIRYEREASGVYELPFNITSWLERQSALFGWVWCLGVAFLSLRLLGGYWLAQRLRRRGTQAPDAGFAEVCRQWSKRLGILRNVQLLESKYITEPLTLGFWKPVVLFPAGMLLQLSPAQVEALLLHELAHVRRYDYLVNLLQMSLDVCFFYHPLFWLLSGETRSRREDCCDDTVLRYTGDRLGYARVLTELKLQPVHPQNAFAMTATGKNNFSMRILRIAGITPQRSNRANLLFLLLLLGGVALGALWPAATKAAEKEGIKPAPVQISEAAQTKQDSVPKGQNNRIAPANTVVAPENASAEPDRQTLPPAVAIELMKMNVLYIGVDNPLTIVAQSDEASEISARLKGDGKLEHVRGNEYIARVLSPGSVDIQVYATKNGREKLIGSSTLRVKRIPEPVYGSVVDETGPYPAPTFNATGAVAIELNKMNVFYIGIDNPLRIAVDGVPADQLIVRVNGNGDISGSNNNYLARFFQSGEAKLEVYCRQQDGRETLLTSKTYRIKRVPDPTPRFCGKKGGSITLDELLACKGLNVLLENFDYDAVCNVVGFECTVLPHLSDPTSYNVTGDMLPELIQAEFAKLTPGAAIFFDDIKVKCPGDAAARNVGGLALKLR